MVLKSGASRSEKRVEKILSEILKNTPVPLGE
jgi:hypothetical protein